MKPFAVFRKWFRPILLVGTTALGAVLLALVVGVARTPLPAALSNPPLPSVRVLDRHGRLLDEYRSEPGQRSGGIALSELPDHVTAAVLAAEDIRFRRHPGIDPLAMMRAVGQALRHGKIVSGASTITQQLARNLVPRPRTLRGKLQEILIALRIERELDKDRILEEYLNRVDFGPGLRGLDAASRYFFDKPAQRLDLAEAALLAGLPRGPSFYNPARGAERARQRRDVILSRMEKAGLASPEDVQRARAQPVRLHEGFRLGGAEHLVRAIGTGKLDTRHPTLREVRTTLDGDLQAVVRGLTRQVIARLAEHDARSAAVLVVDNPTREVLAYVGAPDFWSQAALGQNDGTRALRQPGSALKPFVYAAALQSLGYTAATLLPDIELHLPTPQGDYSPRNYDGTYRGPVRLREALANSLNVPAVHTAQRVGPDRVLAELRRFGFTSLERDGAHYGAAIALGDGEVTLAELAVAYATLANRGRYGPLHFTKDARDEQHSDEVQVVPEPIADLLTDILADPRARQAAFGRNSVLDLPFPVAVKTGTSKGFRDNWTIGYTREVTVAVWVGNFDGRPMLGSSGVTGAGPLFRDVMLAAMRSRTPKPLIHLEHFDTVRICALSGERATHLCPHQIDEHFLPGSAPTHGCRFHQEVLIATSSRQRATPACPDAKPTLFEFYPEPYLDWAQTAGRPLAPTSYDARCPPSRPSHVAGSLPIEPASGDALTVAYPFSGARFSLDPNLSPEQQSIVLRARGVAEDELVWFVLDGRRLAVTRGPHQLAWQLTKGTHELRVEARGRTSPVVRFHVE